VAREEDLRQEDTALREQVYVTVAAFEEPEKRNLPELSEEASQR
jgi:hypothetical protein